MEDIRELIDWLMDSDDIELDGGCSINFKIPIYEITPKDFLKYAEEDLSLDTKKGKIGVVSNLKRAVDCQLDMFFETINIKSIFDNNNLKFEMKTNFLVDINMLPNKSINKLNKIRNKMEHKYTLATLEDLNIYYELVWNMIEIINLNIQLMTMGEIDTTVEVQGEEFCFSVNYNVSRTRFIFCVQKKGDIDKKEEIIVPLTNKEDYSEYVKAFRLFRCMIEVYNLRDVEHFMQSISKIK